MKPLPHALALVAAAIAALASPPALAGEFVSPGLWEHTTLLSPDGKAWRPATTQRGCLTKAQAEHWESQVRQQILAQQCSIGSLTVAGGRIDGVIACTSANRPVVKVVGEYAKDRYAADLAAEGVIDAVPVGGARKAPVKAFARWTGRLVGAC